MYFFITKRGIFRSEAQWIYVSIKRTLPLRFFFASTAAVINLLTTESIRQELWKKPMLSKKINGLILAHSLMQQFSINSFVSRNI